MPATKYFPFDTRSQDVVPGSLRLRISPLSSSSRHSRADLVKDAVLMVTTKQSHFSLKLGKILSFQMDMMRFGIQNDEA